MANFISQAVSVPVPSVVTDTSTYQKKIQGVQFSTPQAEGGDLAQALGLLGGTLAKGYQDQEVRNEKLGIDSAEKVIAGQTDEDKWKLSAIEMIGNYSPDKELQDNPYAISAIEKMRGQYMSAQTLDAYMADRSQMAKVGTASEEMARFNDFRKKRYEMGKTTTSNQGAFDKGFNEAFDKDQIKVASQQRTEQAIELRAIQKGTMSAQMGLLIKNYNQTNEADFISGLNTIYTNARISWMPIPERIEMIKEMMTNIAHDSGDYGRIEKVAQEVIIGTDREGNDVKAGDVFNPEPLKQVATQRTSQIYGENIQKAITELQGKSAEEQNKMYANWEVNDKNFYNAMTAGGIRENALDYRKREDNKEMIRRAKASAGASNKIQASAILKAQVEAHKKGSIYDVAGRPVASSKDSLPEIQYDDVDNNGALIKVKYKWSDAELSTFATQDLQEIAGSNLSDDQKTQEVAKVLTFAPYSALRNTVKSTFNTALQATTIARMSTSKEGYVDASPQLLQTLTMARTSPVEFQQIFGKDSSDQAQIIRSLSEVNNGDLHMGLSIYARGKEVEKDTILKAKKDKETADQMQYASLKGLKDGMGNEVTGNIATNSSAYSRINTMTTWLNYSGIEVEVAQKQAIEGIAKSNYAYRDTLIPKQLFTAIDVDPSEKPRRGTEALNGLLGEFKSSTGLDENAITTTYNADSQIITFSGGAGQYKSYNLKGITDYANETLRQEREGPRTPPDLTVANEARAEKEKGTPTFTHPITRDWNEQFD